MFSAFLRSFPGASCTFSPVAVVFSASSTYHTYRNLYVFFTPIQADFAIFANKIFQEPPQPVNLALALSSFLLDLLILLDLFASHSSPSYLSFSFGSLGPGRIIGSSKLRDRKTPKIPSKKIKTKTSMVPATGWLQECSLSFRPVVSQVPEAKHVKKSLLQ